MCGCILLVESGTAEHTCLGLCQRHHAHECVYVRAPSGTVLNHVPVIQPPLLPHSWSWFTGCKHCLCSTGIAMWGRWKQTDHGVVTSVVLVHTGPVGEAFKYTGPGLQCKNAGPQAPNVAVVISPKSYSGNVKLANALDRMWELVQEKLELGCLLCSI